VGTTPSIFELDSISPNYNLYASILRKFETAEAFPSGNYCYKTLRVERGRVIWLPAHLTNLFSDVIECVDEKRTEVQRVKSVERYNRRKFIAPSWRAVARYKLCQILRWQLVQAMQEQIWRSSSKDYLHNRRSHNRIYWITTGLLSEISCSFF